MGASVDHLLVHLLLPLAVSVIVCVLLVFVLLVHIILVVVEALRRLVHRMLLTLRMHVELRSVLSSHSGEPVGVLLLVFIRVDLEVADLFGDVLFLSVILVVAVGDVLVYLVLEAWLNHVVLIGEPPVGGLPPMRDLRRVVEFRTVRIDLTLDDFLNLVFFIFLLSDVDLTPLARTAAARRGWVVSVVRVLGTMDPDVLGLLLLPSALVVAPARRVSPLLLLAIVELVADACVVHRRAHNGLESVVVPGDSQVVGDDAFDPVVVPHDLDLVDDAVARGPRSRAGLALGVHFVVVARNQQMGNGVARTNFDLAIVPTEHNAVTRLIEGNADVVVGDVK